MYNIFAQNQNRTTVIFYNLLILILKYLKIRNGRIADLIAEGKVIGWFQGRMEFGRRALGARTIIGDARSPEMQKKMNLKIKYRESFRPFAPSIRVENISDYFEIDRESPFMLLVSNVKKEKQVVMSDEQKLNFGLDQLNVPRLEVPAVTHVNKPHYQP